MIDYLVQSGDTKYTELFERATNGVDFNQLSAGVAYATFGGVRELENTLVDSMGEAWNALQKRWLVGINWGTKGQVIQTSYTPNDAERIASLAPYPNSISSGVFQPQARARRTILHL